jgi:hypothetical protein
MSKNIFNSAKKSKLKIVNKIQITNVFNHEGRKIINREKLQFSRKDCPGTGGGAE